eukprot:7043768-Alexandrium_andersonii.AAC.1
MRGLRKTCNRDVIGPHQKPTHYNDAEEEATVRLAAGEGGPLAKVGPARLAGSLGGPKAAR